MVLDDVIERQCTEKNCLFVFRDFFFCNALKPR
jgi:hypothetical protein